MGEIPINDLTANETEDILADLETLDEHVQSLVWNWVGTDQDIRTLFPAQFVKDLGALLSEWYGPIVDGASSA